MKYKLSKHALQQMERRGLSQTTVDVVLFEPENIIKSDDCVSVFQKIVIEGKNNYLYRVFVNMCKKPPLIITVYKTSKVRKYED